MADAQHRQALLTTLTTEHFTLQNTGRSRAVIPVLFWLGLLTFVRVLEKSIEDLYYARAINRIPASRWPWEPSLPADSPSST